MKSSLLFFSFFNGQCFVVLKMKIFRIHVSVGVYLSSVASNRRSSEIQGTALGKSLRAWICIYRSMPAGVAQSRHAFVGGTVSTWGR